MEKKRLRNILVILFIIALLILAFWYGSGYIKDRRSSLEDLEEISDLDDVLAMEPAIEAEPAPEPEMPAPVQLPEPPLEPEPVSKIERYKVDEHRVVKGESFSLITGYYWEDIFLWPDLYIRNDMTSDDPDLIYPDEIIDIYNRLGVDDSFSDRELSEILEAYLEVYEIYKNLGDRKNNSIWSLLWCAARYDHDFLDNYADRIDPADRAMAQKYIDEQGFLD